MNDRIHIVVDEAEKERFRRQAEREGKSLSAWLRDLARQRVADQAAVRLDTLEELRAFFARCDEREAGEEPEWSEHRRVIESSKRSGAGET